MGDGEQVQSRRGQQKIPGGDEEGTVEKDLAV